MKWNTQKEKSEEQTLVFKFEIEIWDFLRKTPFYCASRAVRTINIFCLVATKKARLLLCTSIWTKPCMQIESLLMDGIGDDSGDCDWINCSFSLHYASLFGFPYSRHRGFIPQDLSENETRKQYSVSSWHLRLLQKLSQCHWRDDGLSRDNRAAKVRRTENHLRVQKTC